MISFITSLRIFSAFIILWAAFAFGPFSAIAPKDKVRILIISSPFDHPYGSHMYEHEGKLLAKCLEQTPGVEAVTSYGWPKDPAVLKNVKGLVFYSKSAFDLMMADSVTKGQAMELLNNKVGFSCIHMSTLATDDKMIGLLGARWYFKWLPGERLNLDVRPTGIIQADPKHPISRGWKDFEMRDEIYLSTIFHPKAKPLVKAKAFAGEEVVAWTFERENGGRSFGTTLGHFHQTFRTEAFRKLLVNAILWTAGVKVPKDGAPVNITPAEDILPPNPRAAAIAAAQPIDEGRFEKQVLVPACNDPMQIAVRGNGDVYFIERNGNLRLYDVKSKHVKTLGTVPVYNQGEVGMLGFALDNGFDKSQALYLFFCPAEKNTNMRLSRFVLKNGMLDMTSEKMLFEYPGDTNNGHQGGGIYMSADGDLLIGTGDNTNHMLELPVDQREGFEKFDAQRSSANTNSLRGKILRIHPLADGSYTIPPGNLFEKTDRTRPEIFAMGVRNGFRVVEDPIKGFIYWGDVGQNVNPNLGIGPNSYDEVNQARAAGNFGWPMFTGHNEAYHSWDFATKTPGELFDVNAPRNLSRNNTGLVDLPKPQGAFIWYPSTVSEKFPMMGSGGRSAMVGPVYYWGEVMFMSDVMMPAQYDNSLFVFDWMRNWIKVVKLDWNGDIKEILPFMPSHNWRKPIDIKLGVDNSVYIAETGEAWQDNQNSQISRIIYNRGNRAPVAVLKATPIVGKLPLKVKLDASGSYDKDTSDKLTYTWQIEPASAKISIAAFTKDAPIIEQVFDKPGTYQINVTVKDEHGAETTTSTTISAGLEKPNIKLLMPENGGFYDLGQTINYSVFVNDGPNGKSTDAKFDASKVTVTASVVKRWMRNANMADMEDVPVGLQLMRKTTCFACHQVNNKSVGPAYADVSAKYVTKPEMRDVLAKKIISGGTGVWGDVAMPPHPQHTLAETQQMVNWILYLSNTAGQTTAKGLKGTLPAPKEGIWGKWIKQSNALVMNAAYTGKGGLNRAATSESNYILRSRQQKAANFSTTLGAGVIEDFDSGEGRCVQFEANDYITFDDINLKGISLLGLRMQKLTNKNVVLEVHADSKDGPLIGTVTMPDGKGYKDIDMAVKDPGRLHDLVFIVKGEAENVLLSLSWMEFKAGK